VNLYIVCMGKGGQVFCTGMGSTSDTRATFMLCLDDLCLS